MISAAQRQANRRNARHSTGPATAEGRAAVRLNARDHGLYASARPVLAGENAALNEEIRQEYYNLYRPATVRERSLVEDAASTCWRPKRCAFLEAGLLELGVQEAPAGEDGLNEPPPQLKMAYAFRQDCGSGIDAIEKLSRIEARIRRAYNHAIKKLEYALRHQQADGHRQGPRALPQERRIEPVRFLGGRVSPTTQAATIGYIGVDETKPISPGALRRNDPVPLQTAACGAKGRLDEPARYNHGRWTFTRRSCGLESSGRSAPSRPSSR